MPRSPEAVALESDLLENKRRGPLNRIKNFFVGDKFDRKRLAALGRHCQHLATFGRQSE